MPGKYTGKTRAEVRAIVRKQNKLPSGAAKEASDPSRLNLTHEFKLWRSHNPSIKPTTTKKTTTVPEETTKGFSNYGQENTVNPELARDETYSDYAASIRGDAPAEDLYKKSGPPKRSSFKMKGWGGYQKKK